MNADWVEKNCVCYSALSEEEVQKKYVPIHLEDLPHWNMEMNKLAQFTEEMKENVYYLLKNTIPGIGFVLIGPNSAVAFFPDEDKGYRSIEKLARRYMQSVFSRHPDFGATMLDDNGAVIFMNDDRLLHFLRPEDVITENGKLSGKTFFSARGDLMDRCVEKKILGIIKGF